MKIDRNEKNQCLPAFQSDEEFFLSLNWDKKTLEKSKQILKDWDLRKDSYYKNEPKYIKKVDLAEREYFRNCIKFWEERLKNED